jgi:colicin import membrane protein
MSENTELQIIEYRPTAAALAELNSKYKGVVFQVTDSKGMADAKAARAELRGYRIDLEKLRKELKAPALERSRLIDDEAKRITAELVSIEDPIDAQIKAEETRKEAERKAKDESERKAVEEIQQRIAEIRNWPSRFIGRDSTAILLELDNFVIGDDIDFGLYAAQAAQAHSECVAKLEEMLGKAIAQEQEQARLDAERVAEKAKIEAEKAELAKLKAEQAERERLAKAQSEADAEAVRKVQIAEYEAQKAELKAQAEAESVRMKAEREKHESELKAQREESERLEAENRKARAQAEAKAQAEREAERQRLAAQYAQERNDNLRARLAEIQAQDTPIENKLMLAYQMGRNDYADEIDTNSDIYGSRSPH